MTLHWAVFLTRDTPTWFPFMHSRYEECVEIAKGLHFPGASTTDNTALFVLIPAVAKVLHVSVAAAYDLTMGSLLVLSTLIGALAVRKWTLRIIFYFFAAVGITAIASDVYAFQTFPAIAGIPWLVRLAKDGKHFAIIALAVALAAGFCDLMRFRCGIAYIAMVVIMVFACFPKIKAAVLTVAIVCLYFLPGAWFYRIYPLSHPTWHSIYIGLGWIPNSEVPRYQDEVGLYKVRSIDPSVAYCGPQYEVILRGEILRIARHKPWIIAENVLAKLATILLMLGALLTPVWKYLRFDLGFIAAIALGMLPGILVTPNFRYVLAGLCCACLFAARTAIWTGPAESPVDVARA